MTLKNWMIEAIMAELEELEGQEVYGADLGYKVFERYNVDGSYTYSTNEAKEWVKEYFDELGEIVEEIKDNLGAECIPNVFDNVEAFQVVIILEYANNLLAQCETVDNGWNDEIEMTEETIEKIKEELETIKD